ncbi:MAG TPA: nuclear transport factor 2 family protein [Ramlibacter sp.]|nr:nuclear transport factor 2 family protein [Ramlibacter sp.]
MSHEELFESRCATARRYIDAVNARDVAAVLSLYAPDAVVQDPVGRAEREFRGTEALRKFYEGVVARGAKLEIVGPIRGGHSDTIATPVLARVPGFEIDVITTTSFDEQGRICRYLAYWGPANMRATGG